MAEFSEVMRQWKRLCDNQIKIKTDTDDFCVTCPARNFNCGAIFNTNSNTNWDKLTEVVEKWAKEHPEPQYPTWGDWLNSATRQMADGDLLSSHIPFDIAEKLGIQPKEG